MKVLIWGVIIFAMFSCQHEDNLFCGKVIRADKFEQELMLVGNRVPYMDSIGNFEITAVPLGLVVTMYKLPYFANIYSREGKRYEKNYFIMGEGPDEFLSFIVLNQKQDSTLYVQDYKRKMVYGIDLAKVVDGTGSAIKQQVDYNAFATPLQVFYCNDTSLMVKDVDAIDGILYYKYNPQTGYKKRINMYSTPVLMGDMDYMMSIADCLKPDAKKIASLTGTLNQIDVLNLEDSTSNFSFTTAKDLVTLEKVRLDKKESQNYYLYLPRCSDNVIFALYQRDDRKEFHVIDWHGKALFRLGVNENLNDFSIDWIDYKLYGMNEDGEVYFYDLKSLNL